MFRLNMLSPHGVGARIEFLAHTSLRSFAILKVCRWSGKVLSVKVGCHLISANDGLALAQWTPGTIAWLIPVGVVLMAAAIVRLNRLT